MSSLNLETPVKIGCVSSIMSEEINRKLLGEVLTVIDCSIPDLESRKASKSLVKSMFSRASNNVLNKLDKMEVI